VNADGVAIVPLRGEVDISRAAAVRVELLDSVQNRHQGLVVDLSEATYLDSAAVNAFFEVTGLLGERQLRTAFVIPPGSLVERVVSLVDLGSVASLVPDVDTGVEKIRSGA